MAVIQDTFSSCRCFSWRLDYALATGNSSQCVVQRLDSIARFISHYRGAFSPPRLHPGPADRVSELENSDVVTLAATDTDVGSI